MARIAKLKTFGRCFMHAFAILMACIAFTSVAFWYRSRSHDEACGAPIGRWEWFLLSFDSRCALRISTYDASLPLSPIVSFHWTPPALHAWSYTHIGTDSPWPQRDYYHFLGFTLFLYDKGTALFIPYAYVLVGSLAFSLGWLRYVLKSRRFPPGACARCGYDLHAHHAGQKCPECGTVVPLPNAHVTHPAPGKSP